MPLTTIIRERRIGLSTSEQMLFAKRLSFLVGAGMPLHECMQILKEQAMTAKTATLYERMSAHIAEGKSLAVSMESFHRVFSDFAINIIYTGELSGNLASNLSYLAEELRKRHALRKKIIGALIYPAIVAIATIGIAVLLTVYLFPKIMPIFTSMDVALPVTTRALLATSLFLKKFGLVLLGGLVTASVIAYTARLRMPYVRESSDRLLLAIPLVGRLAKLYNTTTVCRTMGTLLRSGMTVSEAIGVTSKTLHNHAYRRRLQQLAHEAQSGKPLSVLMGGAPALFPSTARHLVGTGEQSGNLSGTLIYLADMYESDVDDLTKNISQAVEPVLMIGMGLVVGFVAISVITPIYEITQTLQK